MQFAQDVAHVVGRPHGALELAHVRGLVARMFEMHGVPARTSTAVEHERSGTDRRGSAGDEGQMHATGVSGGRAGSAADRRRPTGARDGVARHSTADVTRGVPRTGGAAAP